LISEKFLTVILLAYGKVMIAERRREEEISGGSLTSTSLFAGLNFPEVPSRSVKVTIERGPIESFSSITRKENASKDMEMVSIDDAETSQLLPKEDIITVSPTHTTITPSRPKGALSTLYATTEIITSPQDSSSFYPDLPSLGGMISNAPIASRGVHSRSAYTTNSSPASEERSDPLSTNINREVNVIDKNNSSSAASNCLLDDLLRENTRLSEEVSQLRQALAQSMPSNGQRQLNTVQQSQLIQTPQQQLHPTTINQQQQATGVSISDTSAPPAAGVKYVCCGSCRQWLLAPKQAVYVVCSGCDAVNNCNLVPLNRRSDLTEAQQLALNPRPSTGFWFLDCLTRPFQA
jgi:LSD1 subclass zinc finger protein